MSIEERLNGIDLNWYQGVIAKSYNRYKENPAQRVNYSGFISFHYQMWLHYTFCEKDYNKSINSAAIVGLCADKIGGNSDLIGGSFLVLKRPIFLLLMSNWDYLYEQFKKWDVPYGLPTRSYPKLWGERCMLHFILKEDYDTLKRDYEYVCSLSNADYWKPRYEPYFAIMNRDKAALKQACLNLCTPEYHQHLLNTQGWHTELYHTLPTAALKLAWILGMEVEVDSPYIPMELMPVKPLEHYEIPYFFLDGYQGEIPTEYLEFRRQIKAERQAKQLAPEQYWTDFLARNKIFREDKSGDRRAIQYTNAKGEGILREFTNPEIAEKFLLVIFHHGFQKWELIPDGWEWDKTIYRTKKEAFFVHTYRKYGYTVTRRESEGWIIER